MKTNISIINKLEMLPQNIPLNINNISCNDNYNYIINYNISITHDKWFNLVIIIFGFVFCLGLELVVLDLIKYTEIYSK